MIIKCLDSVYDWVEAPLTAGNKQFQNSVHACTQDPSNKKQTLLERVARVIAADPRGAMQAFEQVGAGTLICVGRDVRVKYGVCVCVCVCACVRACKG